MPIMAVLPVAGIMLGLVRWLLSPGYEGGQTINLTLVVPGWHGAGLLWLVRLLERLVLAGKIGLRLTGSVGHFAHWGHPLLPLVFALLKALVAGTLSIVLRASEMRIVLAILLLCRRNHSVVVLGMLIIIFGRNRIAGGLCVTGQLDVFFCNVGGVAPYFHIGSIRLEDARHWIVTFAMVIAPAHPLVLTVSHDFPAANPFNLGRVAARRRALP
jgi:hypothetical protein